MISPLGGRDRLRVLMTTDTVSGVWGYSLELARALRRDVAFSVAAMGAPATEAQAGEAAAAGVAFYDGGYKLEWMDSPWREVREAALWLRDLEALVHPDVVHLNQYAHGNGTWNAPVLMAGHGCARSWWRAVHGGEAPERYDLYRDVVSAGIRGADYLTAPSEWMLETLRRLYGPLPPSHAIHYGCRLATRRRATAKTPVVFSAGRLWEEAENLECLLEAAESLPWRVVVAGPRIDPGRAGDNVVLLGPVGREAVADWMADAAIFALPTRYEPFGLPILAAALSGCALVLGDIASLREIWGETAHYVEPDDRAGLAATLRRLIEDDGLREEYARRARIRASRYSVTRMRDEYLGVYLQLAGSPTGAGGWDECWD